jgi:biopolymer transport protein ExbD
MTPTIDIVFNLLIFFVLMPVRGPEAYLTAHLPRSGRDGLPPEVYRAVEVTLREQGPAGRQVAIILDGRFALGSDFRALQAALADYRQKGLAADYPVRIAPAPAVRHRWVVRAWDAATAAGFERVQFAVPAYLAQGG